MNDDRDTLAFIIGGEGVWPDRVPFVADAILASDWLAAHDRAVEQRTLRDAADEVRRVREHGLRPGETYGPSSESFEAWLRDRADAADQEQP